MISRRHVLLPDYCESRERTTQLDMRSTLSTEQQKQLPDWTSVELPSRRTRILYQ